MTTYDSLWVATEPMGVPNSKLKHYLRLSQWSAEQAFWIIQGIDPKSVELDWTLDGDGYPGTSYVVSIGSFDGKKWVVFDEDLGRFESQYEMLFELWNSGSGTIGCGSPKFFIEWAQSKFFSVPWLTWACEHGYIYIADMQQITESNHPKISDNTLLATIAALLASYPKGKQPTGKELEKAAASIGVSISDDSIRKALKAARELAPSLPSA